MGETGQYEACCGPLTAEVMWGPPTFAHTPVDRCPPGDKDWYLALGTPRLWVLELYEKSVFEFLEQAQNYRNVRSRELYDPDASVEGRVSVEGRTNLAKATPPTAAQILAKAVAAMAHCEVEVVET